MTLEHPFIPASDRIPRLWSTDSKQDEHDIVGVFDSAERFAHVPAVHLLYELIAEPFAPVSGLEMCEAAISVNEWCHNYGYHDLVRIEDGQVTMGNHLREFLAQVMEENIFSNPALNKWTKRHREA
ncbi:hypothetical protein [Georgenia yuyongxinii]